jgi:hypothetical protein
MAAAGIYIIATVREGSLETTAPLLFMNWYLTACLGYTFLDSRAKRFQMIPVK